MFDLETEGIIQMQEGEGQAKEVGELKKKNSYTYWVDENNKSRELPPEQRPVKIENITSMATKPLESGPSQWNTSGTWEQRKISLKELQQRFTLAFNTYSKQSQFKFLLKKITLNGECETIFSRNKKALVYELKGTIEFQTQNQQLKIEISELTDHGDREYSVMGSDAEEKKKLERDAEFILQILENSFKNI